MYSSQRGVGEGMQSPGFGVEERERIPFLSPKVFPLILANSRPRGRAVTPKPYSSVKRITCTSLKETTWEMEIRRRADGGSITGLRSGEKQVMPKL